MSKYLFSSLVLVLALSTVCFVNAQAPGKVPRIGLISVVSGRGIAAREDAFRQGLRELGYVEGNNILIESRYAEGKFDRLPALIAELMRLKIDIVLSTGPAVTRRLKQAKITIPIVMAWDNDPVDSGFVASLARPGGNITGLSTLAPELSGKQMELLKEMVPNFSRLAVLGHSPEPGNAQSLKELELATKAFGVTLQKLDVVSPKDIPAAFEAASKREAKAILILPSPVIFSRRAEIVALALNHRLPVSYPFSDLVQDGGLMFYGPQILDLFRRAATYVDKILKGTKPADLPVQQASKFELVINLKTAQQIGLTIPPQVLARADRVIR